MGNRIGYRRGFEVLAGCLAAAMLSACAGAEDAKPSAAAKAAESPSSSTSRLSVASAMKLSVGEVKAVANAWITIPLSNAYTSMVVIATPAYTSSSVPLVPRIRNAAGSSFELRVDRFDGRTGSVAGVPVQYLVVEAGVYSAATHGIKMEAATFTSTTTDRSGSWNGQSRTYQNSYTNPVVLGQVMTYADARPSVFWSRGSSASSPPTAKVLKVGKHVGEDKVTARANETIGYVVVESGTGTLGGVAWEARLGGDIVTDVTTPAASYPIATPGPATVAVLSQSAMDGGDGSWALLAGPAATSGTALLVHVDEDNVRDTERSHAAEQVAYFAINQCPGAAAAGQRCGDGGSCQIDGSCCPDADADGVCNTSDTCPGYDDRLDGDHDGKPDGCDACPTDPAKSAPGICGCGTTDLDADADGAADCHDGCPTDPAKTQPGACGCGAADTDTDADGTADCNDACAADPSKTSPGSCGCGAVDIDTDADGTADCIDGCLNDPLKTAGGICGCGVADSNSDGDAVVDCLDACALDPFKVAPGACGCGNLDSDSDGDMVADCIDQCANDAQKTAPGVCGCGVPDADTDGDATPDCTDACPIDVQKTLPGVCGCGVPDVDSDGDGVANCVDRCPLDNPDDADGDGVCNSVDRCPGYDDRVDQDQDGLIDGCEPNPASCVAGLTGPGVYTGSITVDATNTAWSLSKLANVWCVTGYLAIYGTNLTDLSALSRLTAVGASMSIGSYSMSKGNAQLQSLHGLEHLQRIAGTLEVYGDPQLANVDALNRLTYVKGISFNQIPKLSRLPFLSHFTELSGNVQLKTMSALSSLEDFAALQRISGYLQIAETAITDLTGLENLERIAGGFSLGENSNLASLEGLSNPAPSIYAISISGSPKLTSLEPLHFNGTLGGIGLNRVGVADLTPFAGVDAVSYGLVLYDLPNLESLAGLEHITRIGTVFELGYLPRLTTLSGLDSVSSIGTVVITDNDNLTDLLGLGALTTVAEDFRVGSWGWNPKLSSLAGLEQLASVGGSLEILAGDGMTSLQPLSNLRSVGGTLSIAGTQIESLRGLEGITSIGGELSLSRMQATDLQGMPSATALQSLNLVGWDHLTSLSGLSSLTRVEQNLDIELCPELTSLDGLGQLAWVGGHLTLRDLPKLQSLDALSALSGYPSIEIARTGIVSLQGLSALEVSWGFRLQDNPSLSSLGGLARLRGIGGELSIQRSPQLVSLAGLEAITDVQSLSIYDNASLQTLTGLDSLAHIWGQYLAVSSNPQLPQCEVDRLAQIVGTACSYCNGNEGTATCE